MLGALLKVNLLSSRVDLFWTEKSHAYVYDGLFYTFQDNLHRYPFVQAALPSASPQAFLIPFSIYPTDALLGLLSPPTLLSFKKPLPF